MVSVRRVAPVLLLVAALPLFGAEKSRPPRDLHQVGDHWTAGERKVPARLLYSSYLGLYDLVRVGVEDLDDAELRAYAQELLATLVPTGAG